MIPLDARDAGREAAAGKPVSLRVFGPGYHATAAHFYWMAETPPAGIEAESGSCVLYLGEQSGIIVLYDPRTRETLRVPPSGGIVLTGGELAAEETPCLEDPEETD
jgi:hypothetical protein